MPKNPQEILDKIEEKLGKGTALLLGKQHSSGVPTISSGVYPLDIALGGGGYPRGRIIEIYGPEASGKTTLALHAIASIQEEGGVAGFVDAEHALDPCYAEVLGVDVDSLLFRQPGCGEEALETTKVFLESGVDIVVVDSVAALTPKAELDGDMGAAHMGLQARMMGQAMRKLTALVSTNGAVLLFINQTRQKIGVMFGSPNTTSGGNALKFYASVRLEVKRIATLKNRKDDVAYGNRTRAKVIKNKIAPPFTEAEFDLIWGLGVDPTYALIDTAIDHGVIKRKGSWFSYGDGKLGQGRVKVRENLIKNAELCAEIRSKITGKITGALDD